ncbi:MAG: glyoxalase [Bacteroidota bacterium]
MPERDLAILALRPVLDTQEAHGIEGFLHTTLRPVLKLQNPVLLALVAADIAKRIPGFVGFAPEDQRQRLRDLLRKDSRLKRVLLGVVFGMLTEDELAFALASEAEVRRRTVALLVERVTSQTDAVVQYVADREVG